MPTSLFQSWNTENKIVIGTDRFTNLGGGGSSDSEFANREVSVSVNPCDPEGRIYNWAKRQKNAMSQYRSNFDKDWEAFYSMVEGNQWVSMGATGAVPRYNRMPGWRARISINYICPTMDEIQSTIFDQDPRLIVSNSDPWGMQEQTASAMQMAIDDVCYKQKMASKFRAANWNALTYGNGYIKVWLDPNGDEKTGTIMLDVVPTQNLFIDKYATSFDDATAVLELSYVPLSQLQQEFPNLAHLMRPESAYGSFGEQLTEDGTLNTTMNRQLQIITPADDNPYYADKTIFTNPPAKKAEAKNEPVVERAELWIKDNTIEEYEEKYVHSWDSMGRPVEKIRIKKRKKYPKGRLIVFGGGIICQDIPNKYPVFPPYVLIQDWITPGIFYAEGEPAKLAESQRSYNKMRGQLMDTTASTANPVTFYEKDSGFQPSMLGNAPGQMIPLNPGGIMKVRRQDPPQMPPYFMQALEMPKGDIAFQSGTGGGRPTGRSGSAVAGQEAAVTKRTRLKSKQVLDALIDLGKILVSFIQEYYSSSRMVKIIGSNGNSAITLFHRGMLKGQWDLKIEAGTVSDQARATRRQEALQLKAMNIIDDRNLLEVLEWPGREEVMRRKGLPPPPNQIPGYEQNGEWYPAAPDMNFGNGGRGNPSGYALNLRATTPAPTGPPGMPPPGFTPPHPPKGGGHKPPHPPHP